MPSATIVRDNLHDTTNMQLSLSGLFLFYHNSLDWSVSNGRVSRGLVKEEYLVIILG